MTPDADIRPSSAADAAAHIRRLSAADAAAAASLSASVGWNQDEADWRRLIALHPEGAFGAWHGAELVGTATLVSYGDRLAWLGMVIVAREERGRGLGGRLVDAALASRPVAEGAVVGLDATEFGEPVYLRRGLQTVAFIDRWTGVIVPDGAAAGEVTIRRARSADLEDLAVFDRSATGVDRSRLLERLLGEDSAVVMAAAAAGGFQAFGAVRSGRTQSHIGPLVVREQALLAPVVSALAEHTSGGPVYLDAVRLPQRTQLLASLGLSVSRRLIRMTRPAVSVMGGEQVVAAMGFEWG